MERSSRVWGLDFLRAVAVLTVVYAHGDKYLSGLVAEHARWTVDGVTLFFVLSGFLIGGILIRDLERAGAGRSMLLRFWQRRWYRTLPAYLLALLLAYALAFGSDKNIENAHRYLLFMQNIAWTHPAFFPEAWSLAVEEWFYLLTPLLVVALVASGRWSTRTGIPWVVGAIVITCLCIRTLRAIQGDIASTADWDAALRKVVVARLDSIAIGVMGAWVAHYAADLWRRWRIVALCAGVALAALDRVLGSSIAYLSWVTLLLSPVAYALMLPYFSSVKVAPGATTVIGSWLTRWISFTALISYSMYLLHYSTVRANTHLLFKLRPWVWLTNGAVQFAVYVALSYAAAYLMYRWVELPSLRLRDALAAPSRTPAMPLPQQAA